MSYTMICAIFHILGVYLARIASISDIYTISIICIAVTAFTGIIRKKINPLLLLAFFMLSVGSTSYSIASYNKLYNQFPDKYVTITGTVISTPYKSNGEYRNKYILKPETVSYMDTTVKSTQNLYIRTKIPYRFGDKLTVSGFLTELSGRDNQYDFDYSLSFRSKGIYNQLTALESEKIGEINHSNPIYWLGCLKNFVHETIFYNYGGEKAGIYNAILLGDKSYLSNEYKVKLLKTGVYQVLYSPYIHIFLLTLLAGLFRIKSGKNRVLFLLLLIYALVNSGTPNAFKASVLAASALAYRKIFGYSDKMQLLSLLLLTVTLINPMLCFNRGFIMSVSSTVILFVFYPIVNTIVCNALRKNRIKNHKPLSYISVFLTLLLCCFPISAYLFNGAATFSTLLSTLLIPVIFGIIFLSLFHIPALALLSGIFRPCVDVLLNFIEKLPFFIEKIPGHYINAQTPEPLQLITAYLIMWLVLQILAKTPRDDTFRTISGITLAFMICTIPTSSAYLGINFVNVGQGDSAILHTSSGETVLIDGGGSSDYDTSDYNVGDQVLMPYMISHGFTRLDYAIVTHFHKDHAEGIVSALKNLRVKNLVMPDSSASSPYRIELEQLASKKGTNIIYAQKGKKLTFDSGLTISFLAPDSVQESSDEPNDTAIVARVDYHGFTGIFASDSTDIVDEDYPHNIDLLKVAHHGSETASSKEDINHLSPKYAVISVGKNNSYGLPHDSVLKNLDDADVTVLRTDILGDIRFKIEKSGKITYKSHRKE